MSLGKVIVDILSDDFTDILPATVLANNPDAGWILSTLPEYTYKSLGTLWLAPGSTKSQLQAVINYKFGEGRTVADGEIAVFSAPVESVNIPEPMMSNAAGAETSYVEFVMKQPDGEMSTDRNGTSRT